MYVAVAAGLRHVDLRLTAAGPRRAAEPLRDVLEQRLDPRKLPAGFRVNVCRRTHSLRWNVTEPEFECGAAAAKQRAAAGSRSVQRGRARAEAKP